MFGYDTAQNKRNFDKTMEWYYSDGRQQFGPVSAAQLQDLQAAGKVAANTLVWRTGIAGWVPFETVRDQFQVAEAPVTERRFCSQCGSSWPASDLLTVGGAVVCPNCKNVFLQQLREGVPSAAAGARRYGGFWIRFLAVIIDGIILWLINTALTTPLFMLMGVSRSTSLGFSMTIFALSYGIGIAIGVLYEAGFVVHKGATPGKMALSLQVIRADGARPGWGLAIGRYFGKMVSSFTLLIGFIMAGVDEEKRALHDRICDTRVVKTA